MAMPTKVRVGKRSTTQAYQCGNAECTRPSVLKLMRVPIRCDKTLTRTCPVCKRVYTFGPSSETGGLSYTEPKTWDWM